MALKNRVFLGGLLILAAGVLTIVFAPLLVSKSLRVWLWWQARENNLSVQIGKIEAPLFRPAVLSNLHVTNKDDAAFCVDARAGRVVVGLNLQSILFRTRGRAIRTLSVTDLDVNVRRNYAGKPVPESSWTTLQRLVPDNFDLERSHLRVENGSSVFLLQGFSVSASQIEAGRFQAGKATLASPLFRQTFSDLHGATNWQNNRLTIAGITLTRGLDAQSITSDLSRLGKGRIGFEFDLDAFGGKIRGSTSSEWRTRRGNWNVAGSAKDISLSQTAEAFGFTGRVAGLLHAGKFTFRGDMADPLNATASLWTELTDPTWRDRQADVIMLGVDIYNRQLQLQQLYVRQKNNQLTLSGEGSFPKNPSGWLHPDFRGNISASIDDLGEFAYLFGGARADFAGKISVQGTVNARDRKLGGYITATGGSLTMFGKSIDTFNAQVDLKPEELEVDRLEMQRKNDYLWAQGRIDTSAAHNYSGTVELRVDDIREYLSSIGEGLKIKSTSAIVHATISSDVWDAQGTLDPPMSKPVSFTTNFKLPIGTDWEKFSHSPISLTFDFPALFVSELPHGFMNGLLERGVLNGKLSMSETPVHPRITGDVQLAGGRVAKSVLNVPEIAGHLTFDGYHAAIDSLHLGSGEAGAFFSGQADFQDTSAIVVRLVPTQPMVDLSPAAPVCISRLELTSVPAESVGPNVGAVEFRGGISAPEWRIALREPELSPSLGSLGWDFTSREFPLCSAGSEPSGVLILGLPAPEEKKHPRVRRHRR
jgi:hypothetical protein